MNKQLEEMLLNLGKMAIDHQKRIVELEKKVDGIMALINVNITQAKN